MLLTNKTLDDFYDWLKTNKDVIFEGLLLADMEDVVDEYNHLPFSCKCALIIDWFDSVGYQISIKSDVEYESYGKLSYYCHIRDICYFTHATKDYDSRKEAQIEAIKKANEIYNNLNK